MAASAFPTSEEEIRADARCSFDKVANTWILEDEDECYEWIASSSSWKIQDLPIDDLDAGHWQDPAQGSDDTANPKKRKAEDEPEISKPKAKKEPKPKEPRQPKQNSSIWVTNLPLDATFEELDEAFSRWGGMIAKNIDTGKPRIKMYTDDQGEFNGEALITFFQPQSVAQAILLADDRLFRDIGNAKISVQEASMEYKKNKEVQSSEPREDTRSKRDKASAKRLYEEQMAKLADWSDEDPQEIKPGPQAENKYADTVIVRNMFDTESLEREKQERLAADAKGVRPEEGVLDTLADDLHELNEEKHWGTIVSIDIFDGEADGIVKIKFDSPESAINCAKSLPAVTFDKRHLQVEVATKRYRFRKAPKDEEDEALRLKWFGKDTDAGNLKNNGQNA